MDYTHLTASQTLEAVYTPYTSALTDGGELPEILVDGSFSSRAEVSHTTEDVTWTDDRGRTHAGTAYTVTVDDPDLEQVSYTVHYRLPDPGKRYDLWVLGENGWDRGEHEIDGQYLLLTSRQAEITFCVLERAGQSSGLGRGGRCSAASGGRILCGRSVPKAAALSGATFGWEGEKMPRGSGN